MERIAIPVDPVKARDEWLRLRAEDITSTDVAALFGVSPYKSHFQLWHEKRDKVIVSIEENERMWVGARIEPAIALMAAERYGWKMMNLTHYGRIVGEGIGSSFDYARDMGDNELAEAVEIKNVDGMRFYETWIKRGKDDYEAPPHIEFQLQHQMLILGVKRGWIVALVGGNELIRIEREADPKVQEAIIGAVRAFWASIKEGKEPPVDWNRDASFLCSRYSKFEPGHEVDASPQIEGLVFQRQDIDEEIKALQVEKDKASALILQHMEDAAKVKGETYSVTRTKKGVRINKRLKKAGS